MASGFDGSSIRGWKSIEASDMLAMPDPATAFIDPFCAVPTLSLTCTIAETGTKELYTRDPRGIAQRAEKYLDQHRAGRLRLHGAGSRVLHLRQRPVRQQEQRHLLQH